MSPARVLFVLAALLCVGLASARFAPLQQWAAPQCGSLNPALVVNYPGNAEAYVRAFNPLAYASELLLLNVGIEINTVLGIFAGCRPKSAMCTRTTYQPGAGTNKSSTVEVAFGYEATGAVVSLTSPNLNVTRTHDPRTGFDAEVTTTEARSQTRLVAKMTYDGMGRTVSTTATATGAATFSIISTMTYGNASTPWWPTRADSSRNGTTNSLNMRYTQGVDEAGDSVLLGVDYSLDGNQQPAMARSYNYSHVAGSLLTGYTNSIGQLSSIRADVFYNELQQLAGVAAYRAMGDSEDPAYGLEFQWRDNQPVALQYSVFAFGTSDLEETFKAVLVY